MTETQFKGEIRADHLVQEIIQGYPQTALIFARYGLQCVGCYISPFHTVADSARTYAIPLESLLHELNQATGTSAP